MLCAAGTPAWLLSVGAGVALGAKDGLGVWGATRTGELSNGGVPCAMLLPATYPPAASSAAAPPSSRAVKTPRFFRCSGWTIRNSSGMGMGIPLALKGFRDQRRASGETAARLFKAAGAAKDDETAHRDIGCGVLSL